MTNQEAREYAEWRREKAEREKKRGDYWLSAEGRDEIRDVFGNDREDGSVVVPLYQEVERLEAELARVRAERDEIKSVLETIRDFKPNPEYMLDPYAQVAHHARSKAREALAPKGATP